MVFYQFCCECFVKVGIHDGLPGHDPCIRARWIADYHPFVLRRVDFNDLIRQFDGPKGTDFPRATVVFVGALDPSLLRCRFEGT